MCKRSSQVQQGVLAVHRAPLLRACCVLAACLLRARMLSACKHHAPPSHPHLRTSGLDTCSSMLPYCRSLWQKPSQQGTLRCIRSCSSSIWPQAVVSWGLHQGLLDAAGPTAVSARVRGDCCLPRLPWPKPALREPCLPRSPSAAGHSCSVGQPAALRPVRGLAWGAAAAGLTSSLMRSRPYCSSCAREQSSWTLAAQARRRPHTIGCTACGSLAPVPCLRPRPVSQPQQLERPTREPRDAQALLPALPCRPAQAAKQAGQAKMVPGWAPLRCRSCRLSQLQAGCLLQRERASAPVCCAEPPAQPVRTGRPALQGLCRRPAGRSRTPLLL